MEELPDAAGFVGAEVVHACRSEGASTLADVLDRRLQVGLNLDAVTPALIHAAAVLMEQTLGWDEGSADRAAQDYQATNGTRT
jgi:glycerol-3-phosphate dehydrogenase